MASYTYSEYQKFFENLVKEKTSTGNEPSEALIKYTKLNWSRAKRNDKTFEVLPETDGFLDTLSKDYIIKIITEPWCGDAAQIVPAIAGIANNSEKLETEIVLRDENDELMKRYLTNGGKAIPISIIIDKETGEELGHWGPRPVEAQKMVMDYKSLSDEEKPAFDEFVQALQKWYNSDKTASIQLEFIEKFNKILES